jgi:hypothetical protein
VSDQDPGVEAKRAHNQTIFRKTNEQIRTVVEEHGQVLAEAPFVCECSDPACRRILKVSLDVYEDVRASPRRFLHALEHMNDGTSAHIVEGYDGFVVMEKEGVAAEVAEEDT